MEGKDDVMVYYFDNSKGLRGFKSEGIVAKNNKIVKLCLSERYLIILQI